jgi:chemotaxis protein MotA
MVVVFAAVIGGFVMEGGHLLVLFQPAEFLIIGGAAIGSILVGTPLGVLKAMVRDLKMIMGAGYTQDRYKNLLLMLYELFSIAKRDGVLGLEQHMENPKQSSLLKKYPDFGSDHHAVSFLADTMKIIITGAVNTNDLESLMDVDLETHHEEKAKPSSSLNKVGDALPGLGIVAAVLGVVITMGAIDGPPEEIGHKVGAALVGTFLGILLSYGFVQPLASNIEHRNADEARYFACIKEALIAFHKGTSPAISVEFARRNIYTEVRPSFKEVEDACRKLKST